jgi:hypothetical protein
LRKTKPKTEKIAKAKGAARSARVYRVVEKLVGKAAEITAPQAKAVYEMLARNKAGLTAAQILEKLASNEKFMASRNPKAMVATNTYDLIHGTGVVKTAGLIEIVGKPEAAPAEKKPKSAKPEAAKVEAAT